MSGAAERARRLKRVLAVQEQKRKLEEWRVAHLARERAELDADDRAMLESLSTDSALHGLFAQTTAKSLKRNDASRRTNAAEADAAEGRLVAARRSEKTISRAGERAERAARAEREAADLVDRLDAFLAHRATSLE